MTEQQKNILEFCWIGLIKMFTQHKPLMKYANTISGRLKAQLESSWLYFIADRCGLALSFIYRSVEEKPIEAQAWKNWLEQCSCPLPRNSELQLYNSVHQENWKSCSWCPKIRVIVSNRSGECKVRYNCMKNLPFTQSGSLIYIAVESLYRVNPSDGQSIHSFFLILE